MKVILLRDARIRHLAGEIVQVSPAEFNFLVSTGSAKPLGTEAAEAEEQPKAAKKPAGKAKKA